MTVEIRFEDRTRHIVLGDLPGAPLLIPRYFKKVDTKAGVLLVPNTPEGNEGNVRYPDVLVGEFVILSRGGDREIQASRFAIDPPDPFKSSDLTQMWTVAGMLPRRADPVVGQGFGPGIGRGERTATADNIGEVLVECHGRARMLLSRWPSIESREDFWRNTELRGGREDLRLLDRRSSKVTAWTSDSGRPIPLKTVRLRASEGDWHSNKLHTVARRMVEVLHQQSMSDEDRALSEPFDRLARRSRTLDSRPDQPFSSWTPNARRCYAAIVTALMTVKELGVGTLSCPLTDLWRLYEDWIGAECAQILSSIATEVHPLVSGPAKCAWHGAWITENGTEVTILAQPTIGKDLSDFGQLLPQPIRSITSDLRPDVLMSMRTKDGKCSLLAIDAKQRTMVTAMKPEEVAEAGSKYLWGIRNASDDSAIERTIIASSASPQQMYAPTSKIVPLEIRPVTAAELRGLIVNLIFSDEV